MTHAAIKGHMKAWGLGCNLWTWWCLRVMLVRVTSASTQDPGAMKARDVAKGHVWICGPTEARV